ncbi:MAG: HNH endonuclease [Acidimicrobiia bacterium]|nr:HNH endonuclease [Acidimicrobiia bacterium]
MPRAVALRSTNGEVERGGSAAAPSVQLADLVERAEGLLAALDSERFEGDEALAVLGAASRMRRVGGALEVLAAGRVEELGAYRRSGHRSTAHLIATRTGTSPARAAEVVETAKRLGSCPRTEEALVAGALSVEQAHAITGAAHLVPEAEGDLLVVASTESVRTLRERARDVRLEAEEDRLGRYRRQHAARSLAHGRDDEGMIWGRFRLPPDLGAAVVNRLEHQADAEYRTADPEGRREGHDRHLADALVTLLTSAGGSDPPVRAAPRADVVVHVSYEALRRGRVESDETCVVRGVGPIPLERARELMDDAFLEGVLVEGTRVRAVRHFGRRIPAELRTALEVRSVLTDGDVVCSIEGCDRRAGLEWDHRDPHAHGGATSDENLQALCRDHHREKTARDRISEGSARRRIAGGGGPDPP